MKTQKKMSIREWWDHVGSDNAMKVAQELGTSYEYLRLLRYRMKRPSPDKARDIVNACNKITPGFAPDFEVMLEPTKPKPKTFTRKIQPSAAFIKSMGAANETATA